MARLASLMLLWAFIAAGVAGAATKSSLPIVNLGYTRHQAIALNQSTQIYNFSNIRYAQPPVGNLRFAAPVAPTGKNSTVENGATLGRICPQAAPAWGLIAENFTVAWVEGKGNSFNFTAAYDALLADAVANPAALQPAPDPMSSEDCLFLDVFAPKNVFNKKVPASGKGGAAVLVWIYGGGYTEGSKYSSGVPEYLMEKVNGTGAPGIIFVAMNYRLGAMGWLAGPTLQASGGVSNAALYDQRLALEWVQKYIHLFGGDPNRVTVMGESAGGGSTMHQITAYGGQQPVPFQQAIPQSPAWALVPSEYEQENTTQSFLQLLNVSSIEEARQLPSEMVIAANYHTVLYANYGTFVFGPVVDGLFVPLLPGQLLADGAFAKNLKIMVGHNANEGVLFTDPRVKTNAEVEAYIRLQYPGIQDSVVSKILSLYPAVYDGTYPWTTPIDRTIDLVSEAFFTCNTNYLDRAFGNKSYAYEFEVPPGLHGEDVMYTFYDGQGSTSVSGEPLVAQIANVMQQYIVNFVVTGNPNGNGVPKFPQYGSNAQEEGFNITGFKTQTDPTENQRCFWWQTATLT